jgi:hypothetical protein
MECRSQAAAFAIAPSYIGKREKGSLTPKRNARFLPHPRWRTISFAKTQGKQKVIPT